MKEGAWINIKTDQFEWVDEHASWIQKEENAEKIGLPLRVWEKIKDMHWDFNGTGRAEIISTVMKAGFIRMRGHGAYWTFEFTATPSHALWTCLSFLDNFAGPFTNCRFSNLRTNETIEMTYATFKTEMTDDPEKVLKIARLMTDEENPKGALFV